MGHGSVFVSTGGFRGMPADVIEALLEAGVVNIELSGGLFDVHLDSTLAGFGGRASFQVHNYFPPADPPFVFNLASLDSAIRERTLECMRTAIDLSVTLGSQRYSCHAGFLLDPPVSYLGAAWDSLPQAGLDDATAAFLESVSALARYASSRGIELLVENNVLNPGTFAACGPDVLLMSSGDQILHMMELLPSGVGLLMDVAHLKVTAQTLSLNPARIMDETARFTRGYHLSDNNGSADSNEPVNRASWFWPILGTEVPFATLELAPLPGWGLRDQVDLVREMWAVGGGR